MSTAKSINLADGGDVTITRAGDLQSSGGELPSEFVLTEVNGNRTEDAPEWFTTRLENRSTSIASRVAGIQQFVNENAQALIDAVNALRDTDQMSADAAAQATAFIDDIATGAPASGTTAGGAAGGTAGAQGAKQVFGG